MTLENKIVRSGVDTAVAARNAIARVRSRADAPRTGAQGTNTTRGLAYSAMSEPLPRRAARAMFRVMKSWMRPALMRLRSYMLRPVEERLARMEATLHQQRSQVGKVDSTSPPQYAQQVRQSDVEVQLATQQARHADAEARFLEQQARHADVEALFVAQQARHAEVEARFVELSQSLARAQQAQLQRIESYVLSIARRIAIPCGNGQILIRTEAGYLLCSAADPAVLATLIETGDLERGTRLLIERLLRPGDTFLDVGANIGMHSLAAARAMQGQGRVIAFEPYEPTARLLSESLWLNGLSQMAQVHQAAVSSRAGRQTLYIGPTSGHNSLFQLGAASRGATPTVEVPVVRLDDVVPSGTAVNLIKIDVEGAETDVLEGAAEVIRANPDVALIVEYGQSHLERTGRTAADWLGAFRRLDLEYRAIDAGTGRLQALEDSDLARFDSVNLLFARKESTAWQRAEAA